MALLREATDVALLDLHNLQGTELSTGTLCKHYLYVAVEVVFL